MHLDAEANMFTQMGSHEKTKPEAIIYMQKIYKLNKSNCSDSTLWHKDPPMMLLILFLFGHLLLNMGPTLKNGLP